MPYRTAIRAFSGGVESSVVSIESRSQGVRLVRLNRAAKLNALNLDMFTGLRDAAVELAKDTSVRAVVLCGDGRAFCAGLDVKSIAMGGFTENLLRYDESMGCNLAQSVSYLWRRVQAPVVCAVQGICFGGGFQIALGADLRFATPSAKFSIMEAKWGIIPDMGITVSALPATVPKDRAKELTFTGRVFDGHEAFQLGLVTKLVDDPEKAAIDFASELSTTQSPDAVRAAKRLLDAAYDDERLLHLESVLQRKLLYSWNQVAKSMNSLSVLPFKAGFLNPDLQSWSQQADEVAEAKLRAMLDGPTNADRTPFGGA